MTRKSTNTKSNVPRINLRAQREKQGFTTKDIHIRVGIPLDHIEALETGVVPKALRGKKLLRSKQDYLKYLGFSKHSKLDVRKKKSRQTSFKSSTSRRAGSTEIVVPTTSKSIFTGFGIAVGMVLSLKALSVVLDNPTFSFDGMLDSVVESMNTSESNTPESESPSLTDNQTVIGSTIESTTQTIMTDTPSKDNTNVILASTTGSLGGSVSQSNTLQDNLNMLVNELIEEEIDEPSVGPSGPNIIKLKGVESTKVLFTCDGHVVFKGRIKRNQRLSCQFTNKSIVEMNDLMSLDIEHNDKRIRPMGPQSASRRLSFVHDDT